jgi:RimJ/RimL family protein N-acetyltransferase
VTAPAPGPPHLSDGTVRLDGFSLDDVDAHHAGEDEEQARRFGWYPDRSTREQVRAAIERWQEQWRTGGPTRALAARDATTGTLVGGCEVRLRADGRAEMSYWTFGPHRGRGFATRAARLACDYAFAELGVERVELYVEPDNASSRAVAAGAGFRQEGVLRRYGHFGAERRDMVLYARLRGDPPAPAAATADAEQTSTGARDFRALVELSRRVVAAFDAVERRPWGIEATMVELTKQLGDLARHVMVAERYYLADRDRDPRYATSTAEIADELADILHGIIRVADHYGVDLEAAHVGARERELAYARRQSDPAAGSAREG